MGVYLKCKTKIRRKPKEKKILLMLHDQYSHYVVKILKRFPTTLESYEVNFTMYAVLSVADHLIKQMGSVFLQSYAPATINFYS